MTSCYLGIDIGATKSHALLTDADGRIISFAETSPVNGRVRIKAA